MPVTAPITSQNFGHMSVAASITIKSEHWRMSGAASITSQNFGYMSVTASINDTYGLFSFFFSLGNQLLYREVHIEDVSNLVFYA